MYIKCFKIVGSGRRETYDAPQSSLHQIILPGRKREERRRKERKWGWPASLDWRVDVPTPEYSAVILLVAHLWTPRVSPRRNLQFHGRVSHGEKHTGHPWWLQLRGRSDRRTNRQTDKHMNIAVVNPLCGGGLKHSSSCIYCSRLCLATILSDVMRWLLKILYLLLLNADWQRAHKRLVNVYDCV